MIISCFIFSLIGRGCGEGALSLKQVSSYLTLLPKDTQAWVRPFCLDPHKSKPQPSEGAV